MAPFLSLPGRRHSTRSVLALFAAALALPILLFAALILWRYGAGERARLEQAALQEARTIAQAVDGELSALLASARILALTPAVQMRRWDEYHRLALDLQRGFGMTTVIREPGGRQLVTPLQPFGTPLPLVSLATDVAVLETKQPAVSDLLTGSVTRTALFSVTVPILRESGEVDALLNLSLPVERLQGLIGRQALPARWVVAVIDRSGTIMARSSRPEDFVGRPATPDLQENTTGPEGTWDGSSADGRAVFGAYARSPLSGWRVAVGVQRSDLAAPLQRSLWWLAALGAGVFVLSALLAAAFGQRITAPIAALAGKAAAIGRGEAVESLDTSIGEIRRVGEALAEASRRLREREAALRDSEGRLRLAIDAGRMAVWELDPRTDTLAHAPELNLLFGFAPEDRPTMDQIRARYGPGERERLQALMRASLENGHRYAEAEHHVVLPDGTARWLLLRAEIMRDRSDAPVNVVGVALDISDLKQAEERQQLLIHELNHRVKNTLATVQSIAAQTLRNADSLAGAKGAFEERLMALSRAHNVLTRENWEAVDLREIALEAVAPYRGRGEDRLRLQGPPVRIPPRMALALAMALQELATNAVKYGALSDELGRIAITWSLDAMPARRRLLLRWEESGGPAVEPPSRRGFGSRLIERSLAQDLDGTVRIDFAPTGVVCTVDAPITGE